MELLTFGLDYSAPRAVRDKLALTPDNIITISKELKNDIKVSELVAISTCNRTEYYLRGKTRTEIYPWLQQKYNLSYHDLATNSYSLNDEQSVKHLMKASCGLKSMVFGEIQILGQIKQSFSAALENGLVDKFLNKLFQQSFATAKKVRTNTALSHNPISVAYAAVKLAANIFSDLSKSTVMVIGAGDTAKLILTHLIGSGVKNIIIANRSQKRTDMLLKSLNIKNINIKQLSLAEIPENIYLADILISSTASQLPIVGKGTVEDALKQRKYKPMYMIDIAIPRDIEPQVKDLNGAYLYCLDDLQKVVTNNKMLRLSEAKKAEYIIDAEADKFSIWYKSQQHISSICKLRDNFNLEKEKILNKSLHDLNSGKEPYAVLAEIANKLTNKFLHKPTIGIKQAAVNSDINLLQNLEEIFNIK